jgi:hypothetical protein
VKVSQKAMILSTIMQEFFVIMVMLGQNMIGKE